MDDKIPTLSITALSNKTGAARQHVTRWLTRAGLYENGEFFGNWEQCLAEVESHRQANKPKNPRAIDPKSGLTWAEVLAKEKCLELRRGNRLASKREREAYMPVQVHVERLAAVSRGLDKFRAQSVAEMPQLDCPKFHAMIDEIKADLDRYATEIKPASQAETPTPAE